MGVGVGVGVGVCFGVGVGVGVGLWVGVCVGVCVGSEVSVLVGVAISVGIPSSLSPPPQAASIGTSKTKTRARAMNLYNRFWCCRIPYLLATGPIICPLQLAVKPAEGH